MRTLTPKYAAIVILALLMSSLLGTTLAVNKLTLSLLDTSKFPKAICNDGNPSGYYYLPATTKPNRWIFHLEGGWWCWDVKSCMGRWSSSKGMVSSSSWPSVRTPGGIFNADPTSYPEWSGVNLVYLPYCSSDAWAGDGVGTVNGTNWQFRGRSVVEAVFRTFFEGHNLKAAQEVLFSGCSAGGQGLLYNLDFAADLLADLTPPGLRIKGFADSGWMMNFPSVPNPRTEIHTQFRLGWDLWKPRTSACSLVNPVNPYDCFFSPTYIGYLTTPVLIQSSAYDAFQIPYDCCSPPFNSPSSQGLSSQLASATRTAMHRLIHHPHSVYSPSCFTHCLSEGRQFTSLQVMGTSLATKLTNWFFDRIPDIGPIIDDCGFNCSTRC